MRPVDIPVADLPAQIGRSLGPGPWHTIDQARVDLFAEATGDDQWIHVDPERASTGPFGGTIAHGYLTLSMLPMLQRELWTFTGMSMGVNYGLDRVRFPSPVRVGSRVRLAVDVIGVEERGDGAFTVRNAATIQMQGQDRPACVAQTIAIVRA